MKIGAIEFDFVGHVCFRFRSPQGRVVLTDPFFADGFDWKGRREKYLSAPAVRAEDMPACDAIFISHIHGDHCDPDAVATICGVTGAVAIGPADVRRLLASRGVPEGRLRQAREGECIRFGDLELRTFGGYDNSYDEKGTPNKFALAIASAGTRFFYSGDCHELPPGVRGESLDAMFCWPHTSDKKLEALCLGIKVPRFVMMHCDRFEPGDFLCNLDPEEQKRRVERLVPGMAAIVPPRLAAW